MFDRLSKRWLVSVLWALVPSAWAVDLGPFTLTGFAKVEFTRASNQCVNCQTYPTEDRQKPWADALALGKRYGVNDASLTLFQPYLGTRNFDLGAGFKVKGLLSQRWRDGRVDIPGVWYEKNLILTHEDHGMVQVDLIDARALAEGPAPAFSSTGPSHAST